MKKFFFPLILLGWLVEGCASHEGFQVVETRNIKMYTSVSPGKYNDTLRALEFGYAALSSSFFKNNDIGKIDVLFLDDPEFLDLMGQWRRGAAVSHVPGTHGENAEAQMGEAPIGKNGLLILRPFMLEGERTEVRTVQGPEAAAPDTQEILPPSATNNPARIAATEMLAHLFIQRAIPEAPLWFHEGFSTYANNVEIRQDDKGQVIACFGYYQPLDVYLGLSKLWDMSFERYADPEVRNWFRSTAHVFMDFTLHGENNAHRAALGPLVGGLAAGTDAVAVVEAAFSGIPLSTLDAQVKLHREAIKEGLAAGTNLRGLCPFGIVVPPEKHPPDGTFTGKPVPAAHIESLFRSLQALPLRDDFPPYYPAEVVNRVKVRAQDH